MGCSPRFRRAVLGCLMGLGASCVSAQRLDSIVIEPQPAMAREAVRLRISLSVRSNNDPWCGLSIDFGDGSAQDMRIGERGPGDLALQIEHRYEKGGSYLIAVRGKTLIRGLRTAFSCDGELAPVSIQVKDAPAQ